MTFFWFFWIFWLYFGIFMPYCNKYGWNRAFFTVISINIRKCSHSAIFRLNNEKFASHELVDLGGGRTPDMSQTPNFGSIYLNVGFVFWADIFTTNASPYIGSEYIISMLEVLCLTFDRVSNLPEISLSQKWDFWKISKKYEWTDWIEFYTTH